MIESEMLFPEIVGQEQAKKKLAFFHRGYRATNIIPHLMFIAPKGCGKTMLAKAMGKKLNRREDDKPKTFLELNCSTIKNVKQFFNQVVIPHISQKECTILFDEASELPKDVTMALLTMLNPNEANRNEFSFEDYVVDLDFRNHSFIFATTEAHKIFHALMDRCERIDLEEYTYGHLGTIVGRKMQDVTFEKGMLEDVASVLRGNARAAQKMAGNLKTYLASKMSKRFTKNDWETVKNELGILPLGVNRIELQILRALKEKKDCSLTHLGAVTGLTTQCIRQDFELFLQKTRLIDISTNGRSLTAKGHKYLKELDAK